MTIGEIMRSIGELMKELGFNPESSVDAQKAFIKNLVEAAAATNPAPTPIHIGVPMPKAEDEIPYKEYVNHAAPVKLKKSQPVQLEFDFTSPKADDSKKVS